MAELFDRFEVNRVPRWPLMSRLVALSIVFHGLFIVAVVYVPALRGLINVAGSVAGIEFVSEDYDRTLIGRRATIVKLEPYEKLYYPPDYFGPPPDALAPVDPTLMVQAAPPPLVIIRQPRVREPRAQVISTPEPSPTPEEIAAATPTPSPSPDDVQKKAEEAELDKIASANGVERPPKINPKPFVDIAQKGKEMFDQGKLNLSGTVSVTATAERNEDGTLKEPVDLKFLQASDQATADLAQEFVMALSQSKVLLLLKGAKQVQMGLTLDQQKLTVKIASEIDTDARASQMATGYGMLLALARKSREGTDEGELFKHLTVSADGRQLVMNFEMPRDTAGKMIADMLAKKAAEAAQGKG